MLSPIRHQDHSLSADDRIKVYSHLIKMLRRERSAMRPPKRDGSSVPSSQYDKVRPRTVTQLNIQSKILNVFARLSESVMFTRSWNGASMCA